MALRRLFCRFTWFPGNISLKLCCKFPFRTLPSRQILMPFNSSHSFNFVNKIHTSTWRNDAIEKVNEDVNTNNEKVNEDVNTNNEKVNEEVNNILAEFFDDKKNWGELEVKVGRWWRAEELRIKSNEDLHKLWYVLLKERNMLLTMEYACKIDYEVFPNPERIDKVELSMHNLEVVVKERNRAYWLLETGETGERPGAVVTTQLGLRQYRRFAEYCVPKYVNKATYEFCNRFVGGKAVSRFLRYYREMKNKDRNKKIRHNRNYVASLVANFPNLDLDATQKQFPDVNVASVKKSKSARGNWENES